MSDAAHDPTEPPCHLPDVVVSMLPGAQPERRILDYARPRPNGLPGRAPRHADGAVLPVQLRAHLLVAVTLVEHGSHAGAQAVVQDGIGDEPGLVACQLSPPVQLGVLETR